MISRWTLRSSFFRSVRDSGSYSTLQARFFPNLLAGEWRPALLQPLFCKTPVFQVFDVFSDEFANAGVFAPARSSRQRRNPFLNLRVELNG